MRKFIGFLLLCFPLLGYCANPTWDGIPWTNSVGKLRPVKATTSVEVTNLLARRSAQMFGPVMLDPAGFLIVTGTNTIVVTNNGSFYFYATNPVPSQSIIQLGGGKDYGHLLYLLNLSTNAGFRLPNLSTNTAGGTVYLQSDWQPTNHFESIQLIWNTPNWIEVGRANASGGTNIIQDLIWANNLGVIQPNGLGMNTNNFKILTDGSIRFGPAGGWYSYTAPDAEGGTVYATGSQNVFQTNTIRFSENYLTNLWGQFSASVSIGQGTPDPAALNSNNIAMFNIGDFAGYQMKATNSGDIYNYGNGAGQSIQVTNFYDIYNYGDLAGSYSAYYDAYDIFNFGMNAGRSAIFTNSFFSFNFGYEAGLFGVQQDSSRNFNFGYASGKSSALTNSSDIYNFGNNVGLQMFALDSHDIYNYGDHAGDGMRITNSSDIFAYGHNALMNAALTNSSEVYAFGKAAGTNLIGSYTNIGIFKFGNFAVVPVSGYSGAGTNFLSDDGTYKTVVAGTTINPTDGYIPVRGSATTFTNSPLFMVADSLWATNIGSAIDNGIRFKVSANPSSTVFIGSAAGIAIVQGTTASIIGTGGSASIVSVSDQLIFINKTFYPNASNSYLLGAWNAPWQEVFAVTNVLMASDGTTNKYTDNGTSLLRNGVALAPASGGNYIASSSGLGTNTTIYTLLDVIGDLEFGPAVATAVNRNLIGNGGLGTDKAGGNVTVKGGVSTGTGRGGDLIFQTSQTTNTGAVANSYTTREYISAKWVNCVSNTATTFITITNQTNTIIGAFLVPTVYCDNGTDYQALTSTVMVNAVNKVNTITTTITQVDSTTAASAGTLSVVYTVVSGAVANTIDIKATVQTSLTPTNLRVKWAAPVINSDGLATVTPL